jgi:hypothetical protein
MILESKWQKTFPHLCVAQIGSFHCTIFCRTNQLQQNSIQIVKMVLQLHSHHAVKLYTLQHYHNVIGSSHFSQASPIEIIPWIITFPAIMSSWFQEEAWIIMLLASMCNVIKEEPWIISFLARMSIWNQEKCCGHGPKFLFGMMRIWLIQTKDINACKNASSRKFSLSGHELLVSVTSRKSIPCQLARPTLLVSITKI